LLSIDSSSAVAIISLRLQDSSVTRTHDGKVLERQSARDTVISESDIAAYWYRRDMTKQKSLWIGAGIAAGFLIGYLVGPMEEYDAWVYAPERDPDSRKWKYGLIGGAAGFAASLIITSAIHPSTLVRCR
jgi:hypothetical protein